MGKLPVPYIPKMGRPSTYSEDLANALLAMISTTEFGMTKICKDLNIPYGTFLRWKVDRPDFSLRYAQAKRDQQQIMYEKAMRIAEEPVLPGDMAGVQQKRLIVDLIKWGMGRIAPLDWGDKIEIKDTTPKTSTLTDDQFEKLMKEMKVIEPETTKEDRNEGFTEAEIIE